MDNLPSTINVATGIQLISWIYKTGMNDTIGIQLISWIYKTGINDVNTSCMAWTMPEFDMDNVKEIWYERRKLVFANGQFAFIPVWIAWAMLWVQRE